MDALAGMLAMDERIYRAWSEQIRLLGLQKAPVAEADMPTFAARLIPGRKTAGSVAVVRLSGYITRTPTLMSMLFGGTSSSAFASEVVSALADPSIAAVVMDVDSPGGDVAGTPEAAAQILAARGSKPLVAVANPTMASAAYWLASQADEIAITPSGMAGSIGVFGTYIDDSKALEQAGLAVTVVKHGRRKAEGVAGPLSEEAMADLQARVDYFGEMFEADVARGRKVSASKVASDFGEGSMMTPEQAVKAGLADKVATLDEVLARLAAGYKRLGGARAYDDAAGRLQAAVWDAKVS